MLKLWYVELSTQFISSVEHLSVSIILSHLEVIKSKFIQANAEGEELTIAVWRKFQTYLALT